MNISKENINWEKVFTAYTEQTLLQAQIVEYVGNGYKVEVLGLESFLPSINKSMGYENPEEIVGFSIPVNLTKIKPLTNEIIITYNKKNEAKEEKLENLKTIEVGSVWNGVIKNITSYGLFVTIAPSVDGLVHVKEVSWSKDYEFANRFKIGDEMQVKVIDIKGDRISLSHKQLLDNPWDSLDESIQVGSIVRGRVHNITDYGVFIEISEGIEALLHSTEMCWSTIPSAIGVYQKGDVIEAKVVSLNRENHKMAVSVKQLTEDPWEKIEELFSVDDVVDAVVKKIAGFGLFATIIDGVDGLIHVSEFSWYRKIDNPKEEFEAGSRLKVKIIGIDKDNRQMSLSIKQIEPDPWPSIKEEFKTESIHKGTIAEIHNKEFVIEFNGKIRGFSTPKHMVKINGLLPIVGETLDFVILETNVENKRIIVSHSKTYEGVSGIEIVEPKKKRPRIKR